VPVLWDEWAYTQRGSFLAHRLPGGDYLSIVLDDPASSGTCDVALLMDARRAYAKLVWQLPKASSDPNPSPSNDRGRVVAASGLQHREYGPKEDEG
jgi:hypothetical protein